MQEVYPLLEEAEMIVLASPIYYHSFSGQLQCAINRIYALDKPKKLRKAALILSSGSDLVYSCLLYTSIVFGFYGMNVGGFGGVTMFVPIAVTLILMALSAVILAKLGMFK